MYVNEAFLGIILGSSPLGVHALTLDLNNYAREAPVRGSMNSLEEADCLLYHCPLKELGL